MIAYINTVIKLDYFENNLETDILDEMSVKYQTFYNNNEVHIFEQKISLDEESMNTLFSEFFQNLVDIRYSEQGGRGCPFAIEIVSI